MDERLTAKELDRLADWLTAQGLTPEKVLECIKYIAGESGCPASHSTFIIAQIHDGRKSGRK